MIETSGLVGVACAFPLIRRTPFPSLQIRYGFCSRLACMSRT